MNMREKDTNHNIQNKITISFEQHSQLSKLMLLTKLIWTPRRRWLPEHSRHMKAPMGSAPGGLPGGATMREAHLGCRSGQSEQTMFSGRAMRTLRRFLSCCWEAIVIDVFVIDCKQCWLSVYRTARPLRVPDFSVCSAPDEIYGT